MSSEVRFERVNALPHANERKKSTVYLVADAENPDLLEFYVTGRTAKVIRKLPTRNDLIQDDSGVDITPGPGLKLVGAELRFDVQSLPIG